MGDEVARHIKGWELDAEAVALNAVEHTGGDALGGLALGVAREHPVDVRVVHRPEPLSDVHREMVDRRDDENFIALDQHAALFEILQGVHELGADVQLLNLVAAHRADDADGLVALAEAVAGNLHRLAVRRGHFVEYFFNHGCPPPAVFFLPEYGRGGSRRRRPDIPGG